VQHALAIVRGGAAGAAGAGGGDYVAHWVDCLRHDRDPVTPGGEGRASLEIILAGYTSSAERRFVDLEWQTW
jgi:predicted dehydrogenase